MNEAKSGATAFCSESSREGTNIPVVRGTTQTGMKDERTKATVITLASFGVDQLKKKDDGLLSRFLAASLQMDSATWEASWVEKRLNRVAICLERLRTLARGSLEGFCM